MSGLRWHPAEDGNVAAQLGGTTIGVVYPEGWWSSYILGVTRPAAGQDEGKAALEAEWSDWMERAGLKWRDGA